jgi:hypothetical protein
MLPQIGNEPLYLGDSVTCGLCLHVWIPIKISPRSSASGRGRDAQASPGLGGEDGLESNLVAAVSPNEKLSYVGGDADKAPNNKKI